MVETYGRPLPARESVVRMDKKESWDMLPGKAALQKNWALELSQKEDWEEGNEYGPKELAERSLLFDIDVEAFC